jgi:hypothetical protein
LQYQTYTNVEWNKMDGWCRSILVAKELLVTSSMCPTGRCDLLDFQRRNLVESVKPVSTLLFFLEPSG